MLEENTALCMEKTTPAIPEIAPLAMKTPQRTRSVGTPASRAASRLPPVARR